MTDDEKKLETYLNELEKSLQGLPVVEKSDILLELNTHITESLEKSDNSLEEILRRLGPPQQVAKQYISEHKSEHKKETSAQMPIITNSAPEQKSNMKWFLLAGGIVLFLSIFYSWYKMTSAKKNLVTNVLPFLKGNGKNGLDNFAIKIDDKKGTVKIGDLVDVNEEDGTVKVLGNLVDVNEKDGRVKVLGGLIDVNEKDGTVKIGNMSVNNVQTNTIQGNGVLKSESRFLENFTQIEMSSAIDVDFTMGEQTRVVVKGDENLISLVETEVKNKALIIKTKPGTSYKTDLGLKVVITHPHFNGAKIRGSGDLKIYNLNTKSIKLNIFGSGDIKAQGQVEDLQLKIYGSGDVKAQDLLAQDAHITLMGSGDVEVHVNENLSVNIFGSGNVNYYGNPKNIEKNIKGSGSINQR